MRSFVESNRSNQALVSQARKVAMLDSPLFIAMFVMYCISFYYGVILINEQSCFFGREHRVHTVSVVVVVGIVWSGANHTDW